eukprot:4875334-Lingulodinium_polyedra.AAC.1
MNAAGKAPDAAVEPEVAPAPADGAAYPRRITRGFWITRSNLIQHGYSRGRPKCDSTRAGRQTGHKHTP